MQSKASFDNSSGSKELLVSSPITQSSHLSASIEGTQASFFQPKSHTNCSNSLHAGAKLALSAALTYSASGRFTFPTISVVQFSFRACAARRKASLSVDVEFS